MAAEAPDIETFLMTTLTGDATLTGLLAAAAGVSNGATQILSYVRPQGQQLPIVQIVPQGMPRDDNALDGSRGPAPYLYEIKAIGNNMDTVSLAPIANRIDVLINKLIAQTAANALCFQRMQPISDPSVPFGTNRFSELGGVYRAYCSPLNP